jgi:hypothetical protein
VHLIFSQEGVQMVLPEDQHAVQDLTAQGADKGKGEVAGLLYCPAPGGMRGAAARVYPTRFQYVSAITAQYEALWGAAC